MRNQSTRHRDQNRRKYTAAENIVECRNNLKNQCGKQPCCHTGTDSPDIQRGYSCMFVPGCQSHYKYGNHNSAVDRIPESTQTVNLIRKQSAYYDKLVDIVK